MHISRTGKTLMAFSSARTDHSERLRQTDLHKSNKGHGESESLNLKPSHLNCNNHFHNPPPSNLLFFLNKQLCKLMKYFF